MGGGQQNTYARTAVRISMRPAQKKSRHVARNRNVSLRAAGNVRIVNAGAFTARIQTDSLRLRTHNRPFPSVLSVTGHTLLAIYALLSVYDRIPEPFRLRLLL